MVDGAQRLNGLDASTDEREFDIAAASRECAKEAFEIVSGIMRRSEDESAQISAAKTIVSWSKDGQEQKKKDDKRDGPTFLAGLGKSEVERGALVGAPGSLRHGSNGGGPGTVADQGTFGRSEE